MQEALKNYYKEINKEFKELGYKRKRNIHYQLYNNELVKGFYFRLSGQIFIMNWFAMPLIPYTNGFTLDIGERRQYYKNQDELARDETIMNEFIGSIKSSIFEYNQLLQSVSSINDLYKYFYVLDNWSGLKHVNLKSKFKHYERLIYIKAYLGIDFQNDLYLFKESFNQIKYLSTRDKEVVEEVDIVAKLKNEDELKLKKHLENLIRQSILDLEITPNTTA